MKEYKISEMKVISSAVQPNSTNVLWLNSIDNKLYKFGNNGWKSVSGGSSGGGGITIVDSVDQLDSNAELGSLASVVEPGSIQESSFRDLYQPDMSMLDQTTGTLTQPELLSSVSSMNFLTPTDYSGVETGIIFIPRTFSQTNIKMIQLFAAYSDGILAGVVAMYINQAAGEQVEFIVGQVVDGVYTIDDSVVTAINDILASDDWCYLGFEVMEGVPMTEEQFATLDKFVKAVAGVPSKAYVYLKKDNWEELYAKDFEKLASNIDKVEASVNAKADKMPIESYSSYGGVNVKPNVYTTYTLNSGGSMTIKLADIADSSTYNEYIIEIRCTYTPASVVFKDSNNTEVVIKWANGLPPTFEAGCTYLVSIVNGLGLYTQFLN
jgi:hypothetical protein